jgi:hypothetical protein
MGIQQPHPFTDNSKSDRAPGVSGQRSGSWIFLIRADASSLKEVANNVIQGKQQGELQPEFQAMMDRFRRELLQIQAKQKH